MYELINTSLKEWKTTTDSRTKLQHTYIVSAAALLFAAGIIGLINYDLGQQLLFVAILAGAMFVINAIAWALLQSFVLLRIKTTPRSSTKSTKTKK